MQDLLGTPPPNHLILGASHSNQQSYWELVGAKKCVIRCVQTRGQTVRLGVREHIVLTAARWICGGEMRWTIVMTMCVCV